MEVLPGLHHVPCPCESFVVHVTAIVPAERDDPAGITLIDSGSAQVPPGSLAPYLARLDRSLHDVRRIINTHGHYDHAGGNGVVKDLSGARLYIHPADQRIAEDPAHQHHTMIGYWRRLAGVELPRAPTRDDFLRMMQTALVDDTLRDGDDIDCGLMRLRVVHTPGHTPGSVCLYWPERELLIAGDAIQGASTRRGGFPLLEDPQRYMASLARIQGMKVETLLLAHSFVGLEVDGAPLRRGRQVKALLDDSAVVERELTRAVESFKSLDAGEMVRAVVVAMRPFLGYDANEIPHDALPTVLARAFPRPGSGHTPPPEVSA